MNLLIKNGKIADGNKIYKEDILIKDGKIEQIEKNINVDDIEIIDASNRLIIPGGVDVHTHMDLDLGKFRAVDDFYNGSLAAAYGGTTTIIDHIGFGPRGSSLHSMVDHYFNISENKAIIDYSFHGVIQEVGEAYLDEMESLYERGIISLKLYMTYGGMLTDEEILKVLRKAREVGTIICVHCENDGAIKELRNKTLEENKTQPIYHALSRPAETEAEAINRLLYLCEIADCPNIYIVHLSTKKGLEEIKLAKKRGVKNIFVETCTQYLYLDDRKYYEDGIEEGVKYICSPPLRKIEDKEALWQGIKDGIIDVIATDHCPFSYEKDKLPYKNNYHDCPGGLPGVEERILLVLTEGLKRGIDLNRLVRLLSTNPSKIFGLYPRKGVLEIGSDGDLLILERSQYIINDQKIHSNSRYTAYNNFVSDFKIDKVISRGQVILEDNKISARNGRGSFIKRKVNK